MSPCKPSSKGFLSVHRAPVAPRLLPHRCSPQPAINSPDAYVWTWQLGNPPCPGPAAACPASGDCDPGCPALCNARTPVGYDLDNVSVTIRRGATFAEPGEP